METEHTEGLTWPIHPMLLQEVSFPCPPALESFTNEASGLPQFPILANAYLQSAPSLRATVCARAAIANVFSLSSPKLLEIYMRETFLDGKQPVGGWAACVELSCVEPLPGQWRADISGPGGTPLK